MSLHEDDIDRQFNNFIKAIVSVARWSLNTVPETDKGMEITNAVALIRQDLNKEPFKCSKCGGLAEFQGRQVPTKDKRNVNIQIIGYITCKECNYNEKYKALRQVRGPREK